MILLGQDRCATQSCPSQGSRPVLDRQVWFDESDERVHLVAAGEELEDFGGRVLRSGVAFGYLGYGARSSDGIDGRLVSGEFVWRLDLDLGRDSIEVLDVGGHDGTCAANDSCSDDVLIVRITETIGALERLPALNERVAEIRAHLGDQTIGATGCIVGGTASLDELESLVGLQFLQDRVTPQRSVDAFDRQRQQEVALQARPQHAGVEDGGKHTAILAGRLSDR